MRKIPSYLSLIFLMASFSIQASGYNNFFVNAEKMHLLEKAWSVNTGGPSCHSYYSIIINERLFPGLRPWELRWDMIKDVIDYKNKKVLELGCCMGLVATSLKKYRDVARSVGVDGPDWFLKQQGSPDRIRAAQWFAQAFEVDVDFIQVDLNSDSQYEEKIGFDYDVVFCLSLLNWIKDKDRLVRYLARFNDVIFEGHDALHVEVARFKKHGFEHYQVLGQADRGRVVIHFYK